MIIRKITYVKNHKFKVGKYDYDYGYVNINDKKLCDYVGKQVVVIIKDLGDYYG